MTQTTQALTTQQSQAVAAPHPAIETTLSHFKLVQDVASKVMKEGVHYGPSFPGDTKKNLHKSGADALNVAFNFVPEFTVSERDLGNGHREYRTDCTIKHRYEGTVIAMGVGTCSTMESKYRWRNAKMVCPKCGAEGSLKFTKNNKWWCIPDKGGCGGNFEKNDPALNRTGHGKVENPDPADCWNTCLKMSKKRALVDATITATGCSDQFTQDAEDMQDERPKAASQDKPEFGETDAPEPKSEQPQAAEPAPASTDAFTALKSKMLTAKHLGEIKQVIFEASQKFKAKAITQDQYTFLRDTAAEAEKAIGAKAS